MKVTRKIIQINDELCDGCGQCVLSCAEGALQIIGGKARVISDNLCDGLGACMGECPNGALRIIECEADNFDQHAVERHLSKKENTDKKDQAVLPCGCPSQHIQTFIPLKSGLHHIEKRGNANTRVSALSHWPIQIRLVPSDAAFLKNADLLVLADCAAVSYARLHDELLAGKAIMMGCPKFDDKDLYVRKFSEIFLRSGIKSITVAIMKVPCCSSLSWIVKKGLESAGAEISVNEILISPQGDIVR